MAHAQTICHAPLESRASARRSFAELRTLIDEWRRRAQSRRELAALSDRCLRDIGLTRYDANREARKPFWRG